MKALKSTVASTLVLTLILSTWIFAPVSAVAEESYPKTTTVESNLEFISEEEATDETEEKPFDLKAYQKELVPVGETYYSSDGFSYTLSEENTAIITGYSDNTVTNLTVPSMLDGYEVSNIGDQAFRNYTQLKSISLPDTLFAIGTASFAGCPALTSIHLPKNLSGISAGSFYGCTALKSIYIPKSMMHVYGYPNENYDSPLLGGPFRKCSSLTSVTFEEGTTTIAPYLFKDCTSITVLTIPSTVTTIGEGAFKNCTNLTYVNIPEGVKVLARQTFAYCYKLDGIVLPTSLTAITDGTFKGCKSLKSINIPKSLVTVNGYPGENTTAYGGAFYACESLKTFYFEEGVHTIPAYFFKDLEALETITIPSTVTTIGEGAFKNCTNLRKVNIPEGVTGLEKITFENCYSIEELTLPSNLQYLTDNTFKNCTGLKSINIPKTLKKVNGIPGENAGYYGGAFNGCTRLETITIEDGMEIIPDYLIKDCSGLKAIVIPESVTKINTCAFKNCPLLKNVYVMGQNTYIVADAFYGDPDVKVYCPKYSETHMNLIDAEINVLPMDDIRREEPTAIVDTQSYYTFKSASKVTFTCDYTIKDEVFDKLSDMSITIRIPSNSQITDGSMYLDRTRLTGYSEENGLIDIPVTKKTGTVTFDLDMISSQRLRTYAIFNYTLKEAFSPDAEFVENYGIYVCADNGWTPFCYAWTDSDRNEMWPGIKMTRVKDNIYGYSGTKFYENVIFNNSNYGDGNQTEDLKNPGSGYMYTISTNKWTQLADFTESYDIIDIINEEVPFITINAPTVTASESFSISGAAPADKVIKLYIDDTEVSTAHSNKVGSYQTTVTLPDTEKNKSYTLKAVTTDTNGTEISSQSKIRFNDSAPTLTEFTMEYNGATYDMLKATKQNIVFTLSSFHGDAPFKYIVKLDNPELAGSVYITSTRSGVTKYIEATYNENENAFIAQGFFDESNHDYVPGKINVHFTEKKEEITVNEAWVKEQLNDEIPEAFKDAKLNMVKETDDEKIMTVTLSDGNVITYTIKRHPLDSFVKELEASQAAESIPAKSELASVGKTIDEIRNEAIFEENADIAKLITEFGWKIVSGEDNVFCTKQETTTTEIVNYVIDSSMEYAYEEAVSFVNDTVKDQFFDLIIDETSKELVETSFTIGGGLYTGGSYIAQWGGDSVNLLTARYEIMTNPNLTQAQKESRLAQIQQYQDMANGLMVVKVMGCMFKTISATGMVDPSTALIFWAVGFALEDIVPFVLENEEDIRMKIESTHTYKFLAWVFDISWIIDPSGFVYEGVTSNRVEGAKVTAYWIPYDEENTDFWNETPDTSQKVLWNAEEYSQLNPLYTDADGNYSWDVPEGWWKVVCEKEGYETYETEWLPIPPPQTEVNINLRSTVVPEVESFDVSANGLEVRFNTYMNPATLNGIILTDSQGNKVSFTTIYDKNETDTDGNVFAKEFTFTPTGYNKGDHETFTLSISDMESYAGVKLLNVSKDFEITFESSTNETVPTEPSDTPIIVTKPTEPSDDPIIVITPTEPESSVPSETPTPSKPAPIPTDPHESTPSTPQEPSSTAPQNPKEILGDVNNDGKLNIRDATAIQKYLAKLIKAENINLDVADFDQNTKVNVKDATNIQKKLAGLI